MDSHITNKLDVTLSHSGSRGKRGGAKRHKPFKNNTTEEEIKSPVVKTMTEFLKVFESGRSNMNKNQNQTSSFLWSCSTNTRQK